MRLHRIELVTGEGSVDLPFHHQTTVIAGLGRLEREALACEVMAALRQGRPGLSADISTQVGRRLEVSRPVDGPTKVTDVDTMLDVTDEFFVDGIVHPVAALGVTDSMRVTHDDLAAAEAANDRVLRLAALDQDELWGLAISLAELEVEIARQVDDEAVGERISAEASEQIEQARATVDIAQGQLEERSDQWIIAAASLTIIAFTVALITHPLLALPFLASAIAVAYQSWKWHKQHERALQNEQALLEEFGLESYLDYQLRKVDALTNDTQSRRKNLTLAEKRRFASEQWRHFVGSDVSLDWAATHRPTIAAAAKLRGTAMLGNEAALEEATALALAERIRVATETKEPTPLIVDDIFEGQPDAAVERLLWLIDHHCQQLQFIVMSGDPRVLRWAGDRNEAHQAAIVRLAPEPPTEIDLPSEERGERSEATEASAAN